MKRNSIIIVSALFFVTIIATGSVYSANHIQLLVNGESVKVDVSPSMIKGRVLVPIRFVSEALGLNIQWDQSKQQVTIDKEVWKEPILDEAKLSLRGAANTVNTYLLLLQSAYETSINDSREYTKLLTGAALTSTDREVFMPSSTGSDLNYVPSYEILDGRLVNPGQDEIVEIAASYWLLTTSTDRFTKYTKVYTVKQETVDGERVWLIEGEKTLKQEAFKEKPAQLHAPFEH